MRLTLQEQLSIPCIQITYNTEFNDSNVSESVPLCEILILSECLGPYISHHMTRQHLLFRMSYIPASAFVSSLVT